MDSYFEENERLRYLIHDTITKLDMVRMILGSDTASTISDGQAIDLALSMLKKIADDMGARM